MGGCEMANLKKVALLSLAATTALMASGYKIPEQSQKGVALSSAYVANAHGADASYYNPANMAFETGNGSFEIDLSYIHLTSTRFEGTVATDPTGSTSASSKKENFLIPTFYYVSPAVDNFRFGLTLTSPVGLTKRWEDQPAKASAEEFSLITYEINPTLAYKVNEKFSVAAGLRMIYSDGAVKSTAPVASASFARDMEGDGLDFGYNIALTYKPVKELALAATYRSKIDLDIEGDARLSNSIGGFYSGPVSICIPAPATLNLAAAYTFNEKTTIEFVYDKAYWSKYKTLDFDYQGDKTNFATLQAVFDAPIDKSWKDTDSYRLGVTHKYDSDWTVMAGLVYFETPVPEKTLSFELPDSKGMAYSVGARHALSEEIEIGASFMYADRENRTVSNNDNGINGTFSDTAVYFLSLGVEYKF
jgi:long-chain fatty acid transport protein